VATFLVKNAVGLEAVGLLSRSARGWSHRYRNEAFESKKQASVGTIIGSLCQETTNHLKCRLRQEHTPNMAMTMIAWMSGSKQCCKTYSASDGVNSTDEMNRREPERWEKQIEVGRVGSE